MKKIILLLFLYLLLGAQSNAQTVIKGLLSGLYSQKISLVINQNSLNNHRGQELRNGTVNESGTFELTFNLDSERPATLYFNNTFLNIWLIPNTVLTINEVASGNFIFDGPSSKNNNFLYQSGIMRPYMKLKNTTSKFEPETRIRSIDNIITKNKVLLKEISIGNTLSNVFQIYALAEIEGEALFEKNQYPQKFIYIDKSLKVEEVPKNYYDFWSNFRLVDDSCESPMYERALSEYISYLANQRADINDREINMKARFQIMDSLLANRPLTLQKQKTAALMFAIRYLDLPTLTEAEIKKYEAKFPWSPSLTFIKNEWNKKNANRFITPDFRLKNPVGKVIDIKELKGKVVYIDFWGSWCTACLQQMPNSKRVQEQFKGREVEFLYIDFYDSNDKWLSAIKQYNINGLHMKAEREDELYFDKVFGINQGFPRYALLDKAGRLVSASAPHPSDAKLIEMIEKYLK